MQLYSKIMLLNVLGISLYSCQREPKNSIKSERPNILVFISDDQRWDQISYADNPIIPQLATPNIDKLASQGCYFRNAFVTTSISAVSRASIVTGRYSRTHGMNHFNTPLVTEVLNKSYPAILHNNGYRTGYLGKWGVGVEGTGNVFDIFNAWADQGSYFLKTDSGMVHNSEWLAIEAGKFLKSCSQNKPFCLIVGFKAPHAPYLPDKRDTNLFEHLTIPRRITDAPKYYSLMSSQIMDSSLNRWCYFDERKDEETKNNFERNFLRCVVGLDRAIGKIMSTLNDLKLKDNTIVIFISDNGYMWGEHGLGGKWLMYEESIRVPLIIDYPGLPAKMRGEKVNDMALNIDVAPTILDLAGLKVPPEMDGISLKPVMMGDKSLLRSDFFMEHVNIIKVEHPIPDCEGVRSVNWKYIRYLNADPPVEEVFNLEKDPHEIQNLADDTTQRVMVNKLRKRYSEYLNFLNNRKSSN
jgi:arylsulfatase A-like enzyme